MKYNSSAGATPNDTRSTSESSCAPKRVPPPEIRAMRPSTQAFDGSFVTSRPQIPYDPIIHGAKVYEWKLKDAVVLHDAEYYPETGRFFITEMFAGELIEVDPVSKKIRHFKLPAGGMPPVALSRKWVYPRLTD